MKYAIWKWYWLPFLWCAFAVERTTGNWTNARLLIVKSSCSSPINALARRRERELAINRCSRTNALEVQSGWDEGIIHIAKWSKQTIQCVRTQVRCHGLNINIHAAHNVVIIVMHRFRVPVSVSVSSFAFDIEPVYTRCVHRFAIFNSNAVHLMHLWIAFIG